MTHPHSFSNYMQSNETPKIIWRNIWPNHLIKANSKKLDRKYSQLIIYFC